MGHLAMCLALAMTSASAEGDLTVLDVKDDSPAPSEMLSAYLKGLAHVACEQRRQQYESLKTPEECVARQKRMRGFFLQQIGGLPDRTSLNARVVGRLSGDDYRVEKIIYESRPNHRVTAALYLPDSEPPFPAVLIACGHSKNGKAADYNQRMGILLAKNGLAAMCYDPIGQGERSQILREAGKAIHGATTEHFLVGIGAILVGTNTAQYRIFDGIRGIDYLEGRSDIDGQRIGCTGCSGGGTLTSYIMALDDRVGCAAPACYLTTFERLIDTIGPQDAEQNIYAQVAFGMDQTDYVLMRAPKPTLICATTRDFFDIQGSWDNFRESKRFYARLGYPERMDLVEDDAKHGVTKLNRETLTHWMRRWLLEIDDKVTEPDFSLWKDEQLWCSPQGQVLLMPDERSAFDLNIERAEGLCEKRRRFWADASPEEARSKIRQVAGIRALDELSKPRVRKVDTVLRPDCRIEKVVLEPEPGLLLPALVFVPGQPGNEAYLYVDEAGKDAEAGSDRAIGKLVAEGHVVLAVDLPGIGETRSGAGSRAPLGDWKNTFLAYLLGKSLVGMRAENVLVCARYLAEYLTDVNPREVHVVAVGECAVPVLHAAALQPQRFASVRLRKALISWEDVVRTPEPSNQLVNTVHGALEFYDLPDLVALAGEKVTMEEPVDARGEPAESD
jgi:dienelactone hydrolase